VHKEAVMQALRDPPKQIADRRVESIERRDGVKLNLSGQAWVMFRASGTEPLLRIYCEAADQAAIQKILSGTQEFIESSAAVNH
jgi:phosphomannomutase